MVEEPPNTSILFCALFACQPSFQTDAQQQARAVAQVQRKTIALCLDKPDSYCDTIRANERKFHHTHAQVQSCQMRDTKIAMGQRLLCEATITTAKLATSDKKSLNEP